MSLFRNTGRNGRESIKGAQSAEPHAARRAVRYAAADNTQAALQRQFPGVSFVASVASKIVKRAPVQPAQQQAPTDMVGQQAVQTNVRIQNDFAQAA